MVFAVVRLFPIPRQRGEVVEILESVQDLTRPLAGCLGCWVSEQEFLHTQVCYVEQWESEEALHDHIRSDLYRRVLAAMELSKQEPEVGFYYVVEKRGFELVEALRARNHTPSAPLSLKGSKL